PLVAGDSNGTWDVYQYEPFGVGDCEPQPASAMVATTETGCVSLISGGTDPLPSVFLDSSQSGDDVFLATFARLSALDADTDVDVYDARVGGVKAVVVQPTPCTPAQDCQQRGQPPGYETPKSATFDGPENVTQKPPRHCKKGQRKVRRHGKVRCVAKKHRHHKKQK
ncbi:MAG TPA: hypothetical protein VNC15_11030, partial [Solirubrobacterales bacterium]|nr:hypothetical protein [Solirubrobacterales bacterium]